MAAGAGLRSVAFPSISTGAYRFPIATAARIAMETVQAFLGGAKSAVEEVRFVLFSDDDLEHYRQAAAAVFA